MRAVKLECQQDQKLVSVNSASMTASDQSQEENYRSICLQICRRDHNPMIAHSKTWDSKGGFNEMAECQFTFLSQGSKLSFSNDKENYIHKINVSGILHPIRRFDIHIPTHAHTNVHVHTLAVICTDCPKLCFAHCILCTVHCTEVCIIDCPDTTMKGFVSRQGQEQMPSPLTNYINIMRPWLTPHSVSK